MTLLEPAQKQMRDGRAWTEERVTQSIVGIARLVFEIVGVCPICREAVRRSDPRRRAGDRLMHRDCGEVIGRG